MLIVSNYHYIRPEYNAKYPSIFGVTPAEFRQQLLLLVNKGTFVNSLDLLNNSKQILESKEKFYLITFDDGLKEQFDYALPILDELEIPAIFFVNSSNFFQKKVSTVHKIHLLRSIISPNEFVQYLFNFDSIELSDLELKRAKNIYQYDDEKSAILKYVLNFKMTFKEQEEVIKQLFSHYFEEEYVLENLYMNEQSLKELAKRGCLGSHSHNHYPLGLLDLESIKVEIENSKKILEKSTNSKIELIAYPFGTKEACTDSVGEIAKKAGFKFGFTTTRGTNTSFENPLLLNRFDCNDMPGGKNYKEEI
ncbi:polysaccharide deacetylase [Flavobacterium sp. 103]|uniref:polysaccharide deacetylase family protein n=1 Tax=unclassified Flavobacterium TaxID=196869 RepID=UPI000D5EF5E6|nr:MULTISPECIES: polysaccharide deacetylase family protein [unclassified Flavobacterium]PVX46628.1 polysaccharide deacetylase [Flavobacterium sp. 103]QKJ64794.1 polysaccharide deacetylase family protein [Flavobacterium sp. M31R6]